jgi:hypothetical protein
MAVKAREKEKGSGVWWVFIYHGGRRVTRKIGSRAAAEKIAENIQARLAVARYRLPGQVSDGAPELRQRTGHDHQDGEDPAGGPVRRTTERTARQ